jgi:hypothetical protein
MTDKQSKATDQVREHVDRAEDAISEFRHDGISAADGVVLRVLFLTAILLPIALWLGFKLQALALFW